MRAPASLSMRLSLLFALVSLGLLGGLGAYLYHALGQQIAWRDDQMRGVWIDVVGEDHERPSAMSTGEGRAYISRPAMNEDGSLNEDRVSMPKTPGIYAVRLVKSKSPREILAMRYVVVREPASDETGNTDE